MISVAEQLLAEKKEFLELEKLARFGVVGFWSEVKAVFWCWWFGAMMGGGLWLGARAFEKPITEFLTGGPDRALPLVRDVVSFSRILEALHLAAEQAIILWLVFIFFVGVLFAPVWPLLRRHYHAIASNVLAFGPLERWTFFWIGMMTPALINSPGWQLFSALEANTPSQYITALSGTLFALVSLLALFMRVVQVLPTAWSFRPTWLSKEQEKEATKRWSFQKIHDHLRVLSGQYGLQVFLAIVPLWFIVAYIVYLTHASMLVLMGIFFILLIDIQMFFGPVLVIASSEIFRSRGVASTYRDFLFFTMAIFAFYMSILVVNIAARQQLLLFWLWVIMGIFGWTLFIMRERLLEKAFFLIAIGTVSVGALVSITIGMVSIGVVGGIVLGAVGVGVIISTGTALSTIVATAVGGIAITVNNNPIFGIFLFLMAPLIYSLFLVLLDGIFEEVRKKSLFSPDTPMTKKDDLLAVCQELRKSVEDFAIKIKTFPLALLQRGSHSLSVNAPWGSGKTSFITIARDEVCRREYPQDMGWYRHPILWFRQLLDIPLENREYLWIDYDPWHFNDADGLLMDFFRTLDAAILQQTGRSHRKAFLRYAALISEVNLSPTGWLSFTLSNLVGKQTLQEVKDELRNFLGTLDQTIVITLDDIDRMEVEEIMMVLKLVKLLSDFPRILFVLLLDQERVSRIIVEKYGQQYENYLQKIINDETRLEPYTDDELIGILAEQLRRLLEYFGESTEGLKQKAKNVFDVYQEMATGKVQKDIQERKKDRLNIEVRSAAYDKEQAIIFLSEKYIATITPRDIKHLGNDLIDFFLIKGRLERKAIKAWLQLLDDEKVSSPDLVRVIEYAVQSQVFIKRRR